MCGIAGILRPEGSDISPALLKAMGDSLLHRGPDAAGSLLLSTHGHSAEKNLGLAFRRLAILDLSSSGHQPMSSVDGQVILAFNGEIYNTDEIKSRLLKRERVFQSSTDTEVILALYEEMGSACFAQLNGMFAIVIWDRRRQRLIIARDRMGIKPLYHASCQGSLVFASEIKALFKHPGIKAEIDPRAFTEHFSFQFCLEQKSLFAGISELEPGTYQEFSPDQPTTPQRRVQFWSPKFQPVVATEADFASMLRDSLLDSVRRQIRADVPVGCYLSGGMDTGALSALASQFIPQMETFTCGFNLTDLSEDQVIFDERPGARALASVLATRHQELEIGPRHFAELLGQVVWHLDYPAVGISYQNYAIAEFAAKTTRVILSGTGGDELFGGYPWKYQCPLQVHSQSSEIDASIYQKSCRLVSDEDRWVILSNKAHRLSAGYSPREAFEKTMGECNTGNPLDRQLYFDMKGFLRGLLMVEDKLSMAHSLEARVPFLDNSMIDLALTIPAELKFDGVTSKKILRKALEDYLPKDVVHRRKQGFTPPDAQWMRLRQQAFIRSILLSQRFVDRGWFQVEAVEKVINQHMSGQSNHRFLIWSMLCFEMMNRFYIDGESHEKS